MNVVGMMTVKNEADVVEQWCRHHARLYDRLVVVDDSDADDTPEILRRLVAEGLPLTVWSSGFSTFDYRQHVAALKNLRRIADEFNPDYTVIHDADEFIQARSRDELEAGLSSIPDETCGHHLLETFVPTYDTYDDYENPLHTLFRHRVPEGAELPKCIIPRSIAKRCLLSTGSHVVQIENGPHLHGVRMPWTLAHVPVRSTAQTMARTLVSGSKVAGPDQVEQDGGYFPDAWVRERNYTLTRDDLLHYATTRVVFSADGPKTVDVASRMTWPDIVIRYLDLSRVDLTRMLRQHWENTWRAGLACAESIGKVGVWMVENEPAPTSEDVRARGDGSETIGWLDRGIESVSRARWSMQRLAAQTNGGA